VKIISNFLGYIKGRWHIKYALILPTFIFLLVLVFFPLLYSFKLSFYSWNLLRPKLGLKFIGLDNYLYLFSDPQISNALFLTFYFTIGAVGLELLFGMALALLLNQDLKGGRLYKSFLLIPLMTAPVVAGFTWNYLLHLEFGPIPQILKFLGFTSLASRPILASKELVMPAIILVDVWQTTPFVMLVILAGLQAIPIEPYEAAKVDGASSTQIFFKITLPMLKPAILVALLIRTIHAIRFFDVAFVMTGGGPGTASELLPLYNYSVCFVDFNLGYGSAISFLVLGVSAIFSFLYIIFLRR